MSEYPEGGTVDDVVSWVGTNTERADVALEHEIERSQPRKGVLDYLESLTDDTGDGTDQADEAETDEVESAADEAEAEVEAETEAEVEVEAPARPRRRRGGWA